MNDYVIEHRISTISNLWEQFTFHGFVFRPWQINPGDRPVGDSWIARKTVQALAAQEAINAFRAELLPIVDKIAFVSQCHTSADYESLFIQRENGNPEGAFFFRFYAERRPVS